MSYNIVLTDKIKHYTLIGCKSINILSCSGFIYLFNFGKSKSKNIKT